MDALSERRRFCNRLSHVTRHLLEELLGRRRIRLDGLRHELQADCERDQVLLDALVERALEAAAVGIGSEDEPPACCLQLFVVSSLQSDQPPGRVPSQVVRD